VLRLSQLRRVLAWAFAFMSLTCLLLLPKSIAQDDPNDVPLGDVARNLRKKTPSSQKVIDNDNFSTVMDQVESRHAPGPGMKLVMAADSKGFEMSGPDATCSLSFSAAAKALLSNQYSQMELPAAEVAKLEGPAAIEGDALTVTVFNHTNWHVSELTVALMIVKRKQSAGSSTDADLPSGSDMLPQAFAFTPDAVRPEKKPDQTLIYRMRSAAPPQTTAVFSAPLNLDLAADEDWHWSIVKARGYPPEGRMGQLDSATAKNDTASPVETPNRTGNTGEAEQKTPLTPSPVSLAQPQ
jgi:hypothetical protein